MRARALALVLSLSAPAFAQGTGAGEQAFREGRALMQAGDFAGACAKFSESQRLEPAPGTLLNIGQCEERQGHLVAAREAYEKAAAAYSQPERRTFAQGRASAVEAKIPKLFVKLAAGAPRDTAVRAGETPVAIGKPVPMDPGDVALLVTAPGRQSQRVTVTLHEGQTLEIAVEPGGAAPAGAKDPGAKGPPASDHGSPALVSTGGMSRKTAGFVVGGVGLASLAVGAVTGFMAMGAADTVKQHCDGNLACDPEGLDAASSGKTLSLVSTITLAAGVAGVGVGAFLVLTSPKTSTALVPSAGPNSASLTLVRSF
jgi:hypothetical protein